MLGNKESLDQIIVATPGLSSDPVALGESRWDPEDLSEVPRGALSLIAAVGKGAFPSWRKCPCGAGSPREGSGMELLPSVNSYKDVL